MTKGIGIEGGDVMAKGIDIEGGVDVTNGAASDLESEVPQTEARNTA